VVTDGEMCRVSFQSQVTEAVEGFSAWDLSALLWGDWHGDEIGVKLNPLLLDPAYRDFYVSRGWPAERLALSAQYGFATSILGHTLSATDEQAKFRAIVATAGRVWG
jgi:hypothetical protein